MRKTALFNLAKDYHFDFAMRGDVLRIDGKNASIQFELDEKNNITHLSIVSQGWTYHIENDLLFADIQRFLDNETKGDIMSNHQIIKRLLIALDQYPGTADFIDALEDLA